MKLIVQIPCLNEAETLPATIAAIPRTFVGVDRVEILVIDDGSVDGTADIARAAGADHVVRHAVNRGLGAAFQTGLDAALARGADIIVNTDGDNQYCGEDIAALVAPIVEGRADMVIGDRGAGDIAHFSPLKRRLQTIGSAVVQRLSGVAAPDAVSGFRAFSADAARKLTVRSQFSYTTETLIQAGKKRLTVVSAPVRTNGPSRPSRLFRSLPEFLSRSGRTMLRTYAMYEPLKVFLAAGLVLMALGALPILRFVVLYLDGDGAGKVQSLIIGAALLITGAISAMFALIADLVAYNRQILETTLERVRKIEGDLARHDREAQIGPAQSDSTPRAFPEARLRAELAEAAATRAPQGGFRSAGLR